MRIELKKHSYSNECSCLRESFDPARSFHVLCAILG